MATDLKFDVSALDNASRVFARMAAAVEKVEKKLDELDGTRVRAEVEVDTKKAERQVGAFATDLRRKIDAAVKALPELEIDADSTDAQKELARIRKEMQDLGDATIGVDLDAGEAQAKMAALQAQLRALSDESADIAIKADTKLAAAALGQLTDEIKQADREAGQFARNFQRDLTAAIKSLPDIEIDADATPAQQEVARLRAELVDLADQRIGVDIDALDAQVKARAIQEQLDEITRRSPYNAQIATDTAAASAALAKINAEVNELDGKKATVTVDVDRGLADSIVKIAALGRALGTLAIPAAAIAAGPQIAAIGAAAVTASGALLLIPAAGVAAGVAIGTLTAGFKNFGDAVGDNPKKAAEALAKLAPEARETALAVQELAKGWSTMQKAVQNALFADTAETLKQLSGNYLPAIQTSLTGVAKGFNAAAQETAKFLNAPSVVKDLSNALGDVEKATVNASGAMEPLTRAFVDLIAVGADRLPELGKGIADAAEQFADFIDRARESGQLGEWIDNGIQALQQLGSIAGNVGSSLMSVFKAAKDSGADFLGTLDNLTQKVADFLKSGEGQSALVSLFQDIRAGVDAATPGVEALVRAVSGVIQALGDAGVLEAAGRAFTAIAEQVAPVISQLSGLAPVLAGILNTAAGLAPVLVPIAAALGAIKLASMGTNKLSEMGTSIGIIGREAKDADAKVKGLSGKLSGIKGALAGIGPVGILSAVFAVDAATNQGVSDLLNHISGFPDAAARAKQGIGTDFWSSLFQTPPAKLGDQNDIRNLGTTISNEFQKFQAELSGAYNFDPINIPINADTAQAKAAYDGLISQMNGTGVEVEVNGNTVPLGFAYNRVLEEIRVGKAEVNIEGRTVPAEEALNYIKGLAQGLGIEVEVNGKTMPLEQAIDLLYGKTYPPVNVPVDGDPALYDETLRDGVGAALATQAVIPLQGDQTPFVGAVGAAQQHAAGATGTIKLLGDPLPFNGTMVQMVQLANGQSATVTIGANGQPALLEADGVTYTIDGKTGTLQLAANQDPALGTLNGTVLTMNGTSAELQLGANPAAAQGTITSTVAFGNGQVGTMTFDANPNPATGKITGTVALGNGQLATMTFDANPSPADGKIHGTVDMGNGQLATMTLDANPASARGQISGTVSYGNGQTATIKVTANTSAAEAAISSLTRTRTAVVNVIQRASAAAGGAIGGIVKPMHDGGVLRMARGGVGVPLKPMSGGVAQVVKPNTWRVIGDRVTDDEAFIPINGSRRSRKILHETAERMGYAMAGHTRAAATTTATTASPPASVRSIATQASPAIGVGTALADATRHSGNTAVAAAVVAALGRHGAGIRQQLAQLGDRLGHVERSVNITNQFPLADLRNVADQVARTQRTQAALGLFG